jgi:hypothetical protein
VSQIEACPRQWSLEHADYSDRGLGVGYPSRPSVPALLGRAAHCALDRVAKALDGTGSSAVEAIVSGLRSLGGLTKVIEKCVSTELVRLRSNPRVERQLEGLAHLLGQRAPELRLLVQMALSDRATQGQRLHHVERKRGARGPLAYGYHAEVELSPSSLEWFGYADAIRLTPDECEIIDYKTGERSPRHEEQLRLYALLWARDSVLNPSGRLASRLLLVYPDGRFEIPAPDDAELRLREEALTTQQAAAIGAIRGDPPQAIPSAAVCRYCDVKALCSDYWTPRGQAAVTLVPPPRNRSVQGVIEARVGPSALAFVVEADPYLQPGSRALLTYRDEPAWQVGDRVRLVDVTVESDPEVDIPVITFGHRSEVFFVAGQPA